MRRPPKHLSSRNQSSSPEKSTSDELASKDAWALARLVMMSSNPMAELDGNDADQLHKAVMRALRLLYLCDETLRNSALCEAIRFEAVQPLDHLKSTDDDAQACEKIADNRQFKKSLKFVDGKRMLPLAAVPDLVLPGKRWNTERPRLWKRFLKEHIHNHESWGIEPDNHVGEHMASSLVQAFKTYTAASRKACALKGRQRGARKARRAKKKHQVG